MLSRENSLPPSFIKRHQRISLLLIPALFLLGPLPATSSEPEEEVPSFGSGTASDPYQIDNLNNLYWLSKNPGKWDKYFIQTADIDAQSTSGWNDDEGFDPIGNNTTRFTGFYDGQSYEITHLHINRPNGDEGHNQGLFGHVGNSEATTVIRNLRLVNANVTGTRGVGTLIGRVTGNANTLIEYCSSSGGSVKGGVAVGGLIGSHNSARTTPGGVDNPVLRYSFADVAVSYGESGTGEKIAGLAGCSQKGTIQNSYSRSSVTVNFDEPPARDTPIGGLVGCILYRGRVENSYATGLVDVNNSFGENGYIHVGGLVGFVGTGGNKGVVEKSYWDTESTEQTTSAGGEGKTTDQMKQAETYDESWDFENIWEIDEEENDGYPSLRDPAEFTKTWVGDTSGFWDDANNWLGDIPPGPSDNVIIPAEASVEIPADHVGTIRSLIIEDGASLTIKSESLGNSGGLIVSGISEGEVNVERYMKKQWYIISPPVKNQIIKTLLEDEHNDIATYTPQNPDKTYYAILPYDEENNEWNQQIAGDIAQSDYYTSDYIDDSVLENETIPTGTGLLMLRNSPGTVTFKGELATSNVVMNLKKENFGWNSVGNPYSAPINIKSDSSSRQNFLKVNEENLHPSFLAIYVWDDSNTDAPNGEYIIYNYEGGNNYISPGQGFMVRAGDEPVEEDEYIIAFTPDMRIENQIELKSSPPPLPGLTIRSALGENISTARIIFLEGMSLGLDPGYDAGAFKSNSELVIYTRLVEDNGYDFSLQALPLSAMQGVLIPFRTGELCRW